MRTEKHPNSPQDEQGREQLDQLLDRAQADAEQDQAMPDSQDNKAPSAPDTDDADSGEDKSSVMKIMESFTSDDGEETHVNWSLRTVLGGDIFSARWFRQHTGLIVLILFLCILYISTRYASQQELIKIDSLKQELADKLYDALSRSSQLMQRCRQSHIIEYLKTTSDSTMEISTTPPYVITIPHQ